MPKGPTEPLPTSRYSYEAAALEVERLLKRKGRGSQKQAAAACGLTASQFSKRVYGVEMFRVEHFGAIADWAGAPTGWPFIPWEIAEERDKAFRASRRRNGNSK